MIHLSTSAVNEIKRLSVKQRNPSTLFRLQVQNGGCSGLVYVLKFEEEVKPDDRLYNCSDVSLIVDPTSLNYIADLTLDYSEDLMGGGFRFQNPNAIASCGCGNSFSIIP